MNIGDKVLIEGPIIYGQDFAFYTKTFSNREAPISVFTVSNMSKDDNGEIIGITLIGFGYGQSGAYGNGPIHISQKYLENIKNITHYRRLRVEVYLKDTYNPKNSISQEKLIQAAKDDLIDLIIEMEQDFNKLALCIDKVNVDYIGLDKTDNRQFKVTIDFIDIHEDQFAFINNEIIRLFERWKDDFQAIEFLINEVNVDNNCLFNIKET